MDERRRTSSSEPVHPLIEKALTSRVPIAELIGFRVEEIGGGPRRRFVARGPATRQPDGDTSRRRAVRPGGRGHGTWPL